MFFEKVLFELLSLAFELILHLRFFLAKVA